MFFIKKQDTEKIPAEIEKFVEDLKKSESKLDCLKRTYNFLVKTYRGSLRNNIVSFFDLFLNKNKVWQKKWLSCIPLNYLMQKILIESGFFGPEEIKLKWTLFCYFSPHQYLEIKAEEEKTVNIDLWAASRGIKFGDYAHGFHLKTKE